MADLNQIVSAMKNAQAQGKTEEAKRLAQVIKQAQNPAKPTTSNPIAGMGDSVLRVAKGLVDIPKTLTQAATGLEDPRLLVGNQDGKFTLSDLANIRFVENADVPESATNPFGFEGDEFDKASQALADKREDINYAPSVSWDEVKENPTASNIGTFIGEGTLTSLPDMAAALVSTPAYFMSYIAPIAQERAKNDGRSVPNMKDIGTAIAASGVIATAERIGAKGVFGDTVGNVVTRPIKAGGKEGITEGVQNPVQYGAETAGTETGFDPVEALDQAAAGVVQGTGGGAGLKTVSQIPQAVGQKLDEKDAPVDTEAAAGLAQDIQAKAEEGGFDLSDPDTTSSTGAYRAVDNLHTDYSVRMRSIEDILKDSLRYSKDDTPEIRAKKEKVVGALRKGKNKAKNTVDAEDLQAVEDLVGNTAEGQELITLLKKSNELTRLHNQGYKGGLSRITDTLNPFEGGSQYNAGRIAAGPIINMTTGAAAIGTGGLSLAPQVAAVIGGKAIDKYTGRRSIVERYTKQNKDGKVEQRPKKPSRLLINKAKEAQRVEEQRQKQEAKSAEAERKKQLRIEALKRGDPPKGDANDPRPSPEFVMMQALGTDSRREVSDILEQVAQERPSLKAAVESYKKMQTEGTDVLDLNELIAAAKNRAGIGVFGKNQTKPQTQQTRTLSAKQEDGKRANLEFADSISEAVNNDKTIDNTDKAKLNKAIEELKANLGKKPVEKALDIVAEVESKLNRPSLAEKYLLPYVARVAEQQKK